GPSGIRAWTVGPIGLGCKSSFSLPASGRDGQPLTFEQTTCLLDGRLDNRAELRRDLRDHPLVDADCGDRDLVLAAYGRFGERFVEHLEGDFVIAVFDGRANRLLLARDRVGLRPLCYTQCNGSFLFASEAKALLAHPGMTTTPDEETLADFVLAFPSRDARTHTFFQGIHSLPPAHLLIVSPKELSVRRYFDFDTTRQIRLPAFRDYVDTFHDLFVAAVRNRLRSASPVAISVSGGLDSAYIFCVAQQLMRDESGLCPAVLGFNYDGPAGTPSDERGYINAIEQTCRTTIARVAQRPGFMECAGDEVWHSESPMVEALARQGQAVLRAVREAGAGRCLTGHWGDQVLFDSDYLLDLVRSGSWSSARRHARGWGVSVQRLAVRCARDLAARHLPSSVMPAVRRVRGHRDGPWQSPWFSPRFRRLLRERATHLGSISLGGTRHAGAIYKQSRLGYHVQCMEWNNRIGRMHGLDIAFPYLDGDLVQFLMSIPGDVQSHDGVPRGLMREAMRGTVPDAIVDRRSKGEFTHLANESIERDFPAIREILGPTALSAQFGYVDGPTLWKQLDQWRTAITTADDTVLTNRLVDLCGIELFLRRFFETREGAAISRSEPARADISRERVACFRP
ncbi:MAG TPA: asparagine synthase-related protein, partial [Vicinamibacterales bacterium]|nr:asparagine synthase-related protein [Vicinamibacterales bacterium]